MSPDCSSRRHVVVVGAGGNIGSHLGPHLARMEGVARVTLIDRDVYEEGNLSGQDIDRSDVGRPKAAVQARRLRRLNPALTVEAEVASVEDLPLGRLRGDVILTGLDSRRARQCVNEAAWRLGVPWIDAGVDGDALRARVSVYVPGESHACLECPWDERDYALLEQTYPCQATAPAGPPPTRAPAELGALAASLEAIECRKLFEGHPEQAAVDRQVLLDLRFHRQHVTAFRRHPACRRAADHAPWPIEGLPAPHRELTIAALLEAARQRGAGDRLYQIRLAGQLFVTGLRCERCGRPRSRLRLLRAEAVCSERCRACGGMLIATGFDLRDRIESSVLSPAVLRRPLTRLGVRSGDVVSITGQSRSVYLELRDGLP